MTVEHSENSLETDPAQTLGEALRRTRMAAGVSVEQVEADLRIKSKYIEAIEDGDTAALPSRAYTDGFLRNYATYLGLDPADTVSRFASENGFTTPTDKRAVPPAMSVRHSTNNPLAGIGKAPPKRSPVATFGRAVLGLWPMVVAAGIGYGGYTGYVAARDAGLLPPQLGGIAEVAPETPSTETSVAQSSPEPAVTEETAEAPVPEPEEVETPVETASAEPEDVPEARIQIVGNESITGGTRPDRLSYARADATPYWQARPPAVEPADGPVSEIEPETAGLLRNDEAGGPRGSRWSGAAGSIEAPPTDADASRIAAQARRALAETLGLDLTTTPESAVQSPDADAAAQDVSLDAQILSALEAPIAASDSIFTSGPAVVPADTGSEAEASPAVDLNAQVPGIGPIETVEVSQPEALAPAPTEPTQPPRRFALHAISDTWVQVQDSLGNTTYTGIMSAGEAYNIPNVEGLRLKTGNAGGLFIEVDGQRFGPIGADGTVMRNVVLNPGAVRASFTLSRAASLTQQ